MAITAISIPTGVHLSRNIIPLKLQSNSLYIAGGVTAQVGFSIDANPADGDTLQLQWSLNGVDYDVTLIWATSPDNSGNQIALLVSGTMLNYVDTVITNAIALHPVLGDLWEVANTSSGGFWLVAKVYGISDLTAPVTGSFLLDGVVGPITYPLILAEAPIELQDDLFILVRFFVEEEWDSGVYVFIAEAFYKPTPNDDIDGEIHVDIHHFLEPSVRNYFLGTDDDLFNPIQVKREMNKRFRFEAWEYHTASKQNKGYRSNSFRVIHGGMDEYEYTQSTPFGTGWGAIMRFLTYRPNEREVTANQPHYLYWLCPRLRGLLPSFDPEAYYLKSKVYYTDGTNETTTIATDYTIKQFDTVKLVVGFEANGLHLLDEEKTAYKYDVWLVAQSGSEVLTSVVTYYLQPNRFHERFLTWRNSFGVAESTRFYGDSEFIADVEREFAEIAWPLDAPAMADAINAIAHSQKLIREMTLESGPMSAEEFNAHTDLLKSAIVWLHLLPNTSYVPLAIPFKLVPGSFLMGYKDYEGNYINGIQLKLEYMDNINWSNVLKTW